MISCSIVMLLPAQKRPPGKKGTKLAGTDICGFCSSGQRFACGFLQILPHGGHPCRPANSSPCWACRGLSPPSGVRPAGRTSKKLPPPASTFSSFKRFSSSKLYSVTWPSASVCWVRLPALSHYQMMITCTRNKGGHAGGIDAPLL